MKIRFALLGLLGMAGITHAYAADLAAPVYKAPPASVAPFNWSGFYIGGHAGYGWNNADVTVVTGTATFPTGTTTSENTSGFLGGGQIGFNYQIDRFVLGAEGTFSWSGIDGDNDTASPVTAGVVSHVHSQTDWIGTATARVGYAPDNWLFYVKGGAAWAAYKTDTSVTGTAGATTATLSGSETRSGWTVGAGAEYALTPNWSVKVEYDYLDFGTESVSRTVDTSTTGTPAVGSAQLRDANSHIQLVEVGLNYRFNWLTP